MCSLASNVCFPFKCGWVLQAALTSPEKNVCFFLEITTLQFHFWLPSIQISQNYFFSLPLQEGRSLLTPIFQHSLGQGSSHSLTSWKPTHCWTKKWVTVRGSALWLECCFCTWVKSRPLKCWNSSCMTRASASSTGLTWCRCRWGTWGTLWAIVVAVALSYLMVKTERDLHPLSWNSYKWRDVF